MALTLDQILENENIKADRYGMAAISYIFKAFGDVVRSKEYWPWGDTVNFPWENDNNDIYGDSLDSLTRAILCLNTAKKRIRESENTNKIEIKKDTVNSVNSLKKRLSRIGFTNKNINNVTNSIESTSKDINDKINKL